MQVPLSWLKEFVEIDIPAELLAEKLTIAGLEVGHLTYLGLPQTPVEGVRVPPSDHLVWDREKILLGAIREVVPHPNADRLVMALVDYGAGELEQCVTGAPNLFDYKGRGPLESPLWTAFAREGAEVWDGHSDEPKRMILKEKPLRGIPNRSMVCSEKELGLSEEHEGVILLHDQPLNHVTGQPAEPGTPLQDVLGDILLDVELTPNLARCFSVLGVAREVAALTGKPLRQPSHAYVADGAPITGAAAIDIRVPELNPRFTLTLLRGTTVKPSPEWVQRRLNLVGQRPINNIVDATNYITFEIGQPLHAFDYDKLVARAGGQAPTIITRLPEPGETLETLDGVRRDLTGDTILVCDTAGVLSLGGIIGGAETEISDATSNVLLEAANWNYINIRKSMQQQKVFTDAAVRFSRGVHPSQAVIGVGRGIEFMRQWGGGQIAQGIIDEYPLPAPTVTVELPVSEVERLTGITIAADESADILRRLGFEVTVSGTTLMATAPDHRMDIGTGVIGRADLIEEIMRVRGYDTIPNTIMVDAMPAQWENTPLSREERTRDVLVAIGLRENISYRFTTPEREALLIPPGVPRPDHGGYVEIINPISPDKSVLRQSLLTNLLDTARLNRRYNAAQQVFEIGSVYFTQAGQELPDEPRRLAILISGARARSGWQPADSGAVDFYDLKGIVEGLLDGLHIRGASYRPSAHPSLHPGRSATLSVNGVEIGSFGELHPLVARAFDLEAPAVLVADFDLDKLLDQVDDLFKVRALPVTPPVLEDIALIVPVTTPAAEVEAVIRQAGGDLLKGVTLFDVYTGAPVPDGYRSLAYSLVYQTDARTLTDGDVAGVRKKIIKATEARLGAKLRA